MLFFVSGDGGSSGSDSGSGRSGSGLSPLFYSCSGLPLSLTSSSLLCRRGQNGESEESYHFYGMALPVTARNYISGLELTVVLFRDRRPHASAFRPSVHTVLHRAADGTTNTRTTMHSYPYHVTYIYQYQYQCIIDASLNTLEWGCQHAEGATKKEPTHLRLSHFPRA